MLNVTVEKGEIKTKAEGTTQTLIAEAILLIREATNIASREGQTVFSSIR